MLSTLDLMKGYWQIPLVPSDKLKTTFAAPLGLYQFTKMPFGLNREAATFQRVMDKALRRMQDCAVTNIDDILIFSPSREAHLVHLQRVLEALRKTSLSQFKEE